MRISAAPSLTPEPETLPLGGVPIDELVERLSAAVAARLRADAEKLLDRRELAVRLGLSERSISALVSRHELPEPHRLGGTVRWSWPTVERYLAARAGKRPRRGRGIRRQRVDVPTAGVAPGRGE